MKWNRLARELIVVAVLAFCARNHALTAREIIECGVGWGIGSILSFYFFRWLDGRLESRRKRREWREAVAAQEMN